MNNFIKYPLALLVIVLLATAILTKVNVMTRDKISEQEQKKIGNALQKVIPGADSIALVKMDTDSFWVGSGKDGNLSGLSFLGTSRGYSSDLLTMVGIDPAGMIVNVKILSQQETPGLGTRVEEIASRATLWNPGKDKGGGLKAPWFQEQFKGLDAKKEIPVVRGMEWQYMDETARKKLKKLNGISALSGATISSRAAADAVSGKAGNILYFYENMKRTIVDSAAADTTATDTTGTGE